MRRASPRAMIDFLDAGRHRGDHRQARRSGDPHRLADHHRRRLLHRSGHRQDSIPTHPDIVADAANPDSPKTVFGLILAGLKRAARPRHAALHRDVAATTFPTTATSPPTPWCGLAKLVDPGLRRLGRRQRRLPQRHGRPHHAGHHRPRARDPDARSSASRTTGRCSASRSSNGCWRTISRSAARRWKRSACSSSRTSRPSS